eukprot:360285-Chlamydomonas_euryale.AAC.1
MSAVSSEKGARIRRKGSTYCGARVNKCGAARSVWRICAAGAAGVVCRTCAAGNQAAPPGADLQVLSRSVLMSPLSPDDPTPAGVTPAALPGRRARALAGLRRCRGRYAWGQARVPCQLACNVWSVDRRGCHFGKGDGHVCHASLPAMCRVWTGRGIVLGRGTGTCTMPACMRGVDGAGVA